MRDETIPDQTQLIIDMQNEIKRLQAVLDSHPCQGVGDEYGNFVCKGTCNATKGMTKDGRIDC